MHWRKLMEHLMQTVDKNHHCGLLFHLQFKILPSQLDLQTLREIFGRRLRRNKSCHRYTAALFFCFVHTSTDSASCIFVDGHCNNLLLEHANNLDWNRGLGLVEPTKISLPSEIFRLRAPPRTLSVATDRRAVLWCTWHKFYKPQRVLGG